MPDKEWIMVVGSDDEDLAGIAKNLAKYGFGITVARKGMDALEHIPQKMYDLLITDLILDDMTGVDFIKAVKAYDHDIGIIVVSACGTVDLYMEMMALGVLMYLNKPFKPKKLKEAVSNYLIAQQKPSIHDVDKTYYHGLNSLAGGEA